MVSARHSSWKIAADSSSAPYFLALATNDLQSHLSDTRDATLSRVYTTIDLELQRAAVDAVQLGMAEVDKRLAHRKSDDDARPHAIGNGQLQQRA